MIYIIGEAPGTTTIGSQRLADLFGVDHAEMMLRVMWLNMFATPGTDPRRLVAMVEEVAHPGDAIVLLGRRVARAWMLDRHGLLPLESVGRNAGKGPVIIAVPHPSGRNRWWNDPAHVDDAREVLRRTWAIYAQETS